MILFPVFLLFMFVFSLNMVIFLFAYEMLIISGPSVDKISCQFICDSILVLFWGSDDGFDWNICHKWLQRVDFDHARDSFCVICCKPQILILSSVNILQAQPIKYILCSTFHKFLYLVHLQLTLSALITSISSLKVSYAW